MVRYGYHHHLRSVLRADFHDHREKQPSQRWSAHLWQNGIAEARSGIMNEG